MDFYETLNKSITNKSLLPLDNLFSKIDIKTINVSDRTLFQLLKNISSLGYQINNSEIKFVPMFVFNDGRRTFAVEDLTDDDYELLKNVDFYKLPLILRALVADILWTLKKNFEAGKIAAEAYWDLFLLWYEDENNTSRLDAIKRAVCISAQTKQRDLYAKISSWTNDFLSYHVKNEEIYFSLRIMELFAAQKDYDVSAFLPVLDNIIVISKNDISKIEQAYFLKSQCLDKLNKKEEVKNNNISLANEYVSFSERIILNNKKML